MKLVCALLIALTGIIAAEVDVQIEACNNGNIKSCFETGMELTTGENGEEELRLRVYTKSV